MPDRISKIKKAADIASSVMNMLPPLIKPGMSEKQVASVLRKLIKLSGGEGESFKIIVAAGRRTSLPHGYATSNKIRRNDVVMVDFGAVYKGWRSDITRMIFINKGETTHESSVLNILHPPKSSPYYKVYSIVKTAQRKAIRRIKHGVPVRMIDLIVRKEFRKHGLEKYFPHSTGHGIGKKVHEDPRISYKNDVILRAGMVVTVEPGLYFRSSGQRFGIRIEDMVLVTRAGHKILTDVKK